MHDGATRVVLGEGTVLEADVVVSAVGDVPNTEWLAGTGLVSDGVIRVDARGLVRPDIAAVGDLAVFPTPYGMRRIPLWSTAIEHGKVAAAALIHGEAAPPLSRFQPYFWTEQFGLTLKAVGFLPLLGRAGVRRRQSRRRLADALGPRRRPRRGRRAELPHPDPAAAPDERGLHA